MLFLIKGRETGKTVMTQKKAGYTYSDLAKSAAAGDSRVMVSFSYIMLMKGRALGGARPDQFGPQCKEMNL